MVAVDSRLKLKTDRFRQAKLRFPAGSVRSIGELVRLAEFTSTRRRFRRQALAGVVGGAVLSIAAAFAEIPPPVVDESISNSETAWRAVTKPSEGLAMGPLRIASPIPAGRGRPERVEPGHTDETACETTANACYTSQL